MTRSQQLSMTFAIALTTAFALAASGGVSDSEQSESRQPMPARVASLLERDMSRPSEERPSGVEQGVDWAAGPRVNPGTAAASSFKAFTAWGQLYACAGRRDDEAGRMGEDVVELRGLEAWALPRGGGDWKRIQASSSLAGRAFREDYRGNVSVPPRTYARNARGTTVSLLEGHNFHFWPGAGRAALDVQEVAAVAVAAHARQRPAEAAKPLPCTVLSMGADYWRDRTSAWSGSRNNVDAGIGRFKRLDRRWRLFTMTTASPALLRQKPVPITAQPSELR
jgi:hypothetical protein